MKLVRVVDGLWNGAENPSIVNSAARKLKKVAEAWTNAVQYVALKIVSTVVPARLCVQSSCTDECAFGLNGEVGSASKTSSCLELAPQILSEKYSCQWFRVFKCTFSFAIYDK